MRHAILIVVLFALTLTTACADVNFGAYARSIGMGGSGLAIIGDPIVSGAINPAAYAVRSPKTRFLFPSVDYRFEGTSLSHLMRVADDVRSTSGDSAVALATSLDSQYSRVEMDGATGFSAGAVVITVDGQTNVDVDQSTKFHEWVKNPSSVDWSGYVDPVTGAPDVAALQSDYYTDVTGQVVTTLPAVGFGFKYPRRDTVNVGFRLKAVHSSVRRQRVIVADATNSGSGSNPDLDLSLASTTQPDFQEVVEDDGLGMDAGLIYQTPDPKLQLTTALVITNLLTPKLEGVRVDRMVSAGAAMTLSKVLLVSADFVNINGAYGDPMKFRMGAEMRPAKWLALRAGYGGGNITYGFGVKGYDFAFAKQTPLVIGRLWKF